MKLTKRIVTISAATTAAVLLSVGGAQAQGGGESLPVLGEASLLQSPYAGTTFSGTPNTTNNDRDGNNNNNNNGRGPNNNNNNNGGTNNNNNNNNIGGQTRDNGGLLSVLGITRLFNFQVCYPTGHVGQRNTSVNPNINCNQS
ncbi:hypothetical protein [Streptomyces sp. NPDC006333]|uniref:hypothetical protein n=1 Tax=Streptomyces sp. NPDC006333 TaxID=3156753 RepID=UPI0033A1F8F1